MKISKFMFFYFTVTLVLLTSGCATTQERLLDSDGSQVQIRSIQTRAFDTTDREKTLRTVMATLQDLGFVIDQADNILGTVTATKLNKYALRITVSIRPKGETQTLVRANCQYEDKPVYDPEPYQQFFASLEKAMFLTAQQVD
jgi:exosome complex RNA-binding protein Csl4